MIANVTTRQLALDYTKIATPLDTGQIDDDIHECQANYMEAPSELVMWEHQLDWLAKPYKERGRRAQYWTAETETLHHPRPPEIFGVPVRLA